MSIFQFTGLSGAGKTTLANAVSKILMEKEIQVEIIDGDQYRKTISADLGYSRPDREENLRRLSAIAHSFSTEGRTVIISSINPFSNVRNSIKDRLGAKIIWIQCDIEVLIQRDTKGLYRRAMLPDHHPEKIANLTGINDIYDYPENADLILNTTTDSIELCIQKLTEFILSELER